MFLYSLQPEVCIVIWSPLAGVEFEVDGLGLPHFSLCILADTETALELQTMPQPKP